MVSESESELESESEMEVVEVAAEAASSGMKRGRAKLDPDTVFDNLAKKYPSLGSSDHDREAFKKGVVKCRYCTTLLQAGNPSNLSKHFATSAHKKAMAAASATPDVLIMQRAASAALVPVVLERERAKEVQDWLALASIRHALPADAPFLLDGPLFTATAMLQRACQPLSTGGTMKRALGQGLIRLRTEMKRRLHDQSMCIIIGEATTRLAGYKRPMAVILGSSAVGKPLLANLLFDKPTATAAAEAIRESLTLYGVKLASQVTCLVGDNAALVDAIAGDLGLPRLRCIPHCLHLVFKKGTQGFKKWAAVTRGLSRVLTQGGTPRRLAALAKAELKGARLRGNALRWGQMQDISRYLLSDFRDLSKAGVLEAVRTVVAEDDSFRLSGGSASDSESSSEDSGGEVTGGGAAAAAAAAARAPATRSLPSQVALKQLRTALEVDVAEQKRKYLAAFECYLVEVLFGSVPALLTAAGADPENLDITLPKKLEQFGEALNEAAALGMQGVVVSRVFEKGMTDYTEAEQEELTATYSPIVKAAAVAALEQYNKFIPGALQQLQHRMRFHPARAPEAIPEWRARTLMPRPWRCFLAWRKGQ